MASMLDQLGISSEAVASVEPEEVRSGSTVESGLYTVAVDKAYVRKTDSGASMLEIDFKLEDGSDFHYSNCCKSGDEKGNKSTYTSKQGKEVNLPGVVAMTKFLTAIDSIQVPAVKGDVEHFGNKIEALCLTGIQGRKLQIGINQYENFYNGEVSIRNDIKYFLNESGKNAKGEDLVEKVTESLEKNPLKKLKASSSSASTGATPATVNTEVPKSSGWGQAMAEYVIQFVFTPPTFGKKNELCSLNNINTGVALQECNEKKPIEFMGSLNR